MDQLQLLTVKQVCELLNISIPTIYRWSSEGNLPFPKIKVCGRVGFRRVDVESFINDQVAESQVGE